MTESEITPPTNGTDGVPQHAAQEGSPPIEANLQPRPEPVLDAAKLGGLVAGLIVAVMALVALVAAGKWTDINSLGLVLSSLISAALALVAYLAPVWQARKARAKVTPLADPRDALGRQLVARR